jgi:hypothetical protein
VSQYRVFSLVLSLACSGVGAVVPGLILYRRTGSKYQLQLSAGSALVIFVITLHYSPAALVATPPERRLAMLISRHETKDIATLLSEETSFWSRLPLGDSVAGLQACLKKGECNSDELLHFISTTAKNDPQQNDRVSKISKFYLEVSKDALRGTINLYDACTCFGEEIEIWQRSYLYFLDWLSDVNGPPPYQQTMHDFAIKHCDKKSVGAACSGRVAIDVQN